MENVKAQTQAISVTSIFVMTETNPYNDAPGKKIDQLFSYGEVRHIVAQLDNTISIF